MSSVCSNCENIDFNDLKNQYNDLKTQYNILKSLINEFLDTSTPIVAIKGIDSLKLAANGVIMSLRSAAMNQFSVTEPHNPVLYNPTFFSIQDNTPGYGQQIEYNVGGDGPVIDKSFCSSPSQTWNINGSMTCASFGGIPGNC